MARARRLFLSIAIPPVCRAGSPITCFISRTWKIRWILRCVRDVNEVATCPRGSQWSFTRLYLQQAVYAGYVLTDDAQLIWTTFESIHNKAGFDVAMDIPMESFTRVTQVIPKSGSPPVVSNWHCGRPNAGSRRD